MIKTFDRTNLVTLRADMESALLQVAAKHNIVIRVGNARFTPEASTFKVELATKTTDGTVMNKEAVDFKRYCDSFGLKPEHLGTIITFGRDQYKLTGLKVRAPKRPILAQSVRDGKTYILPESAVAHLQSDDYKKLWGKMGRAEATAPTFGECSNDNAYDEKFTPIGKCNRKATTHRKAGFGKMAKSLPYCTECAHLIDESRAEMQAEARANR